MNLSIKEWYSMSASEQSMKRFRKWTSRMNYTACMMNLKKIAKNVLLTFSQKITKEFLSSDSKSFKCTDSSKKKQMLHDT